MSRPDIILIGAGGHCRSCVDVIEQEGKYSIAGIVDRPSAAKEGDVLGYPILGSDDDLSDLRRSYDYALVTVGHLRSAAIRIKLFERLLSLGFVLPVIVSPLSYISKHAHIGSGSIVMHQSVFNANAKIGVNGIINTKALVEHDAVIGDHCHISTGAVVNGGVRIGNRSFIGSQSCIVQSVSLQEDSFTKALSLISEKTLSQEQER